MGDEGVHACPSGYEPITDVNICEEAANYIDIVFDGTVLIQNGENSNYSAPVVCHYCGACRTPQAVIVNSYATDSQWLCQIIRNILSAAMSNSILFGAKMAKA